MLRKGSSFLGHFLGNDLDKVGQGYKVLNRYILKLKILSLPLLGMIHFSLSSCSLASLVGTPSRGSITKKVCQGFKFNSG